MKCFCSVHCLHPGIWCGAGVGAIYNIIIYCFWHPGIWCGVGVGAIYNIIIYCCWHPGIWCWCSRHSGGGLSVLGWSQGQLKALYCLSGWCCQCHYSCFTFTGPSGGLHRLIPRSLPTKFMQCNSMENPKPEVSDKIKSVSVSKCCFFLNDNNYINGIAWLKSHSF